MADDLWEKEKSFWLDGMDFYRQHLAGEAIMVFADPIGILKGAQIMASLEGAPRWQAVKFADQQEFQDDGIAILAYRATGLRPGIDHYMALCSSTYVRRDGAWMLVAHQQTSL